ncbi:aldehyde dehydrogenase family protein [Nocardia salmonicida]|uniref:aldehyde dehydrogenase family protein n=1 Tax=Nocardia salmonicida TaxID=53431 RepID=UPI0007A5493C|nr:aldehyde dehydrogenase family protein [Nocardia salmonicida]
MTIPHARNLIDGQWRDGHAIGISIDPATGQQLGTFADAGAVTARAAIDAARRVFDTTAWSSDRNARAQALFALADAMTARRDELVGLLSLENGKKLADAAMEVDATIPKLRYSAALALTDSGRAAEIAPGMYSMILPQPIGVAAVIVPWNSPVILAVRSFAPALAAGCTVAMKMPAQTALTNGLLYELIADTVPAGVLNAFTESGNDGAPLLVSDPYTDVVSYTGSTGVGRAIMAAAAPGLKRVSLELGGKSPMIVFDDADLDAAVPVLTAAITTFAGQFCMAGSRILVQRGIADELRDRMVSALSQVRVGPGLDVETEMGPLIDREAARRVDRVIDEAAGYAKVLVRGGLVDPAGTDAFLLPALVEVDDVSAPIVQDEVFGPVATFEIFDDEVDAIERANATQYGLAASIWTRDVDRPTRVGRRIDAGTIWTNTWGVIHDQMEEGGFKHSGIGRLNGHRALEEFQEFKHLVHQAK